MPKKRRAKKKDPQRPTKKAARPKKKKIVEDPPPPIETTPPAEVVESPGGLFTDPSHSRADARTLCSLLAFDGIFEPSEIKALIRQAGTMAEKAAESGDDRTYKRMVEVLLKCADLEQKERRTHRRAVPAKPATTVNVFGGEATIETLARIANQLGIHETPDLGLPPEDSADG